MSTSYILDKNYPNFWIQHTHTHTHTHTRARVSVCMCKRHMRSHNSKYSLTHFTQVLPQQPTSKSYQFYDKVRWSAAGLRSQMRVHVINVNTKDSSSVRPIYCRACKIKDWPKEPHTCSWVAFAGSGRWSFVKKWQLLYIQPISVFYVYLLSLKPSS